MSDKEKDVLDVEGAAELLGVSGWTVRNEAREGRIPGKKIGKEWRFSRQALLEWLSQPATRTQQK